MNAGNGNEGDNTPDVEPPPIAHDGQRKNKMRIRFIDGLLFSVMTALPMMVLEGIALEHGLFDERLPMTAWSITMSKLGKQHIETYWLDRWAKFLRTYCCMGIFSLEVGDKEEHLHVQGSVVIHGASDAVAKAAFERFLKYFLDVPSGTRDGEKGYKILVKPCNKNAGQTIIYMIGYCLKQLGESHFKFVCKALSPLVLQKDVRAYARVKLDLYGGKTLITKKNLLPTIYKFWFKHFSPLAMDTCRILTYMLTHGSHTLCQTFVVSYGAQAPDRARLDALWGLLTRPTEATKRVIKKAVFWEEDKKRGGLRGLRDRNDGRASHASTWNPGETDSDSDEYEDYDFEEVRRQALARRDISVRGPEDNRDSFEFPNGCAQAYHVSGGSVMATNNDIYLRDHGYAEHDGEAEDVTEFQAAADTAAPAGMQATTNENTAADEDLDAGDDEDPDDENSPALKRLRRVQDSDEE